MTRTRSLPADADTVFEMLTDLENLSTWLPSGVEVERYDAHAVRLWLPGGAVERRLEVDWENLKVEWGSEATPTYSGSVRVLRMGPRRCAVAVQLTGATGQHCPAVDDWVERALDALCETAPVEHPCVPFTLDQNGLTAARQAV